MKYKTEALMIELDKKTQQLRKDALEMIYRRKAGHPGGSLSSAEIVAVLFFHTLNINPQNPDWEDRDRFILSKGHASALLYAALARKGYFPLEDLQHWGELDCHLQGHPDILKTPGVDMTTGLLGHGIAIGAGLCLASRFLKKKYRVFVLLGDGECQAGVVWEGAMMASKYRLAKLTAVVDYNDVQLDGYVHEIMPLDPLLDKWQSFNWHVLEINGHNVREIVEAFETANEIHNKPTVIIAHTTKGKGVSFMESESIWHGKAPDKEQYEKAIAELGKRA
ncbi:MAG TPA: transketolase [Anaerolineae bacterium]|nr:transketolase [Anaerolineae bacterium]